MHPISGATAVDGHFQDGAPNKQGTIVEADWLNTVQDEIINVILLAGIPLNKKDSDDCKQLSDAIKKLILSEVEKYATKKELENYAKINDLNIYLKTNDLTQTEFGKWTIKLLENLLSIKYPQTK